jgi:ubiquinone/menaquinone biosynthesis C-methylase UbiE
MAVGGGDYDANGKLECDPLVELGMRTGHSDIDTGCGSGRLSTQLSRWFRVGIDYLGIDVVPELLAYARSKATPGYRFELMKGVSIPASDADADFVAVFRFSRI